MKYTIRKAVRSDAGGIARVQVDSWKTTYPGLLPRSTIRANTFKKKLRSWNSILTENELHPDIGANQVFVAIVDDNISKDIKKGQIIGFINGGKPLTSDYPYDAEIYAFYILQAGQRKGVGTALFNSLMSFLVSHKYSKVLVWVVKNNPAEQFYRHMGGEIKESKIIQMGKKEKIQEIGYIFDIVKFI